MDKKINVYLGYYEAYITPEQLEAPFTLLFTGDKKQVLKFLFDYEEHFFIDEKLKEDFVESYASGLFYVADGKPVVTLREPEE